MAHLIWSFTIVWVKNSWTYSKEKNIFVLSYFYHLFPVKINRISSVADPIKPNQIMGGRQVEP